MDTCPECRAERAEQEDLSRRTFLKRALGVAGATLVLNFFPSEFLRRTASAATNAGKTLVVVFQRGGNDGLNTIVPYSDPRYYVVRPSALNGAGNIGIPPPGGGDGAGINLPGTGFAMHPAIQPFLDLYNNNTLAIVTQAGFVGSTQSHFTDQDIIERGLFSATDGWLNRYLTTVGAVGSPAIRAAGMGSDLADSLRGNVVVPALNDLSALSFARLGSSKAPLESNLRALYGQDPALTSTNSYSRFVHTLGPDMLNRVASIEAIGQASPQNGAVYPSTTYGRQLRDVAHIIRSGLGLEVATVDIGGWDTHDDQGGGGGASLQQAARFADFAGGIRAFYNDLGPLMSNVVVLTCTEFGRTVYQNASGGTDHGKASVWFVLGGGVKGGLYHGAAGFPTLIDANLDSGRYIRPTVEFRDLFSDVLVKHFGINVAELGRVFPGHTHVPVGVFV
jgi:uncharacterized protein (DUF1501 family)